MGLVSGEDTECYALPVSKETPEHRDSLWLQEGRKKDDAKDLSKLPSHELKLQRQFLSLLQGQYIVPLSDHTAHSLRF